MFASACQSDALDPGDPIVPDITATTIDSWFRFQPRFEVGYLSRGYGYDSGLSKGGGFLPLSTMGGNNVAFGDIQVFATDDARWGGNVGLGSRLLLPAGNAAVGVNVYFDERETNAKTFQQIGGGVELLTGPFDLRANVYVPLTDRVQTGGRPVYGTRTGGDLSFHPAFPTSVIREYETPLGGADLEVGGPLPLTNGIVRGFLGGYHRQASGLPNIWGVQTRIEARLSDFATLSLTVQNDRVFDTNVVAGVVLRFPGYLPTNRGDHWSSPAVAERLAEPVVRHPTIATTQSTEEKFFQPGGNPYPLSR